MRAEAIEGTVSHIQISDTHALAVLHNQVEGKVLDEEVGFVTQRLAVELVQEGMATAVRSAAAAQR